MEAAWMPVAAAARWWGPAWSGDTTRLTIRPTMLTNTEKEH